MNHEICIRGPQVMAGYWNRPEETARAMTLCAELPKSAVGKILRRALRDGVT